VRDPARAARAMRPAPWTLQRDGGRRARTEADRWVAATATAAGREQAAPRAALPLAARWTRPRWPATCSAPFSDPCTTVAEARTGVLRAAAAAPWEAAHGPFRGPWARRRRRLAPGPRPVGRPRPCAPALRDRPAPTARTGAQRRPLKLVMLSSSEQPVAVRRPKWAYGLRPLLACPTAPRGPRQVWRGTSGRQGATCPRQALRTQLRGL
jgi:hypothetical protein